MAKKLKLTSPGSLVDYAARKHKLTLHVDPSPKGFLSRSITTKGRITVTVKPGGENKGLEPITFTAQVKSLVLKLEDVGLASERLKDVIFLVNDDKNVADFTFEADPDGDLYTQVGGDELNHGEEEDSDKED